MSYHNGMPRVNIEDLYASKKLKPPNRLIEGSLVGPEGDKPPPKDANRVYVSHAEAPPAPLPVPVSNKSRIPFGPLRKIQPKELRSRRDLMEQLNSALPLNESELPTHVYRADMLDFNDFRKLADMELPLEEVNQVQSSLDASAIRLKYHEGYPATPKGDPFWMKLDFEPQDAYDAFLAYQQQGGARTLAEMAVAGYTVEQLLDWFHIYYWSLRVQAFDMFKVVRHQKMRLLRALNVEDDHFLLAEKLMTKMKDHFNGENFSLEDIPADRAIGMLERLVRIQRISAGLGEKGGINDEVTPPKVQSAELIMRQLVTPKKDGLGDETEAEFDVLAESPDNVELAQELIIRLNSTQKR